MTDLEAAMAELTAATGATWTEPTSEQVGEHTIRQCFSREGPPYRELIEGTAGSMWHTEGAPRLDHLGWWVDDAEEAKRRLVESGFELDGDGAPVGRPFSYHRLPAAGARIEVVDASRRERLERLVGTEPAEVLATFARVYARDIDAAIAALRTDPDEQPALRFSHESGLELALIGGALVLAGPDEALDGFRATQATVIVSSLNRALERADAQRAEVVRPPAQQPTGRNATVRFPGGAQIEYVEWTDEVVARVLG